MRTLNITDNYMAFLSALSREKKIELATKLLNSASSQKTAKKKLTLNTRFSGDWGKGKTADDVAQELHQSRNFTREVKVW